MEEVVFDPEFALKVYKVLVKIKGGNEGSGFSYWLKHYVYPLAEANNIKLVKKKKI